MRLSVAIPTYDMKSSAFFLDRALKSLVRQKIQNFEVVISDNSDTSIVYNMFLTTRSYNFRNNLFDIKYIKNPKKGMASNTNEAIRNCSGELIKILYQDDYLAHERSLELISDAFDGEWLVTACGHEPGGHIHTPYYNDRIGNGVNTIGSPSVLTIKNGLDMYFDEAMTWVLDCDLYKRMYEKYGSPTILNDVNVIIGTGEHQTTFTLEDSMKRTDEEYLNKKYDTTA